MKRTLIILLFFCLGDTVHAQQDNFIEIFEQKVLQIDSLKKLVSLKEDSVQLLKANYVKDLKIIRDSITLLKRESDELNNLRITLKEKEVSIKKYELDIKKLDKENKTCSTDLEKLEKYRAEMGTHESQLKQKNDAIEVLSKSVTEKERLLLEEKQRSAQTAKQEKENGKNEALANVIKTYKIQPFENLIELSTQLSVIRDEESLGVNSEVKPILEDLMKYFDAKNIFEHKYEPSKMKYAQEKLKTINQKSESIENINELVENYQTINEGLKEMIERIIALDNRESVIDLSKEVRNQKLNKIMTEISAFIFDYDFNFSDYPYLSEVVLEILKRKQPNPDADISDLLKKL
jgi:myosin heavy subunit